MGVSARYQLLLVLGVAGLGLAALLRAPVEVAPVAMPVMPATASAAPATPVATAVSVQAGQAALLIDPALLETFHFYLLEQAGPDRAGALRMYLRQTLAPGAYRDASLLVDRYLAYMAAHDALLAAHRPAPRDLARIAIWLDQRDRLRQRMLGAAVSQAWYGQEDAILRRILDEGLAADELVFRTALDKAITSFADLARDEPAWRGRLDSYLAAKSRIVRDAGLDESQKSIRVRELLLRTFRTEAERYRARTLDDN